MFLQKDNLKKLINPLLIGSSSYFIFLLLKSSLLSKSVSANPWISELNWPLSQLQEYIMFMLIVSVLTLAKKFFTRHENLKLDDLEDLSLNPKAKKDSRILQPKVKLIFIYSLLYCFFFRWLQNLTTENLFNSSTSHQDSHHDLINSNQGKLLFPLRTLEVEEITTSRQTEKSPTSPAIISTTSQLLSPSPTPPKLTISLPIGRVLGSLEMAASHLALSKDTKTAFVSLDRSGGLKIVDLSNLENPIVTNFLKLVPIETPFKGKALLLSQDGKTLFASNMHRLEIIDVSNLESPDVLGRFEDENITMMLSDRHFVNYILDYRVTMALSKDQKTLFIGGLGLQIIDISDPKNPVLMSSNTQMLTKENLLQTQIQISQNGEKLYLANGSLTIYNATNMKPLGSYSSQDYLISSVVVSKKKAAEEAAYIIGRYMQGMLFEKINISDPTKPTMLESFPVNYHTYRNPYILGLGLDENIAFIQVWDKAISQDIGIFDFSKKEFKMGGDSSLIQKATSLVVFPGGDESKILIAQNSVKISTIQFDTNFPNKRIFTFSKSRLGSLVTRTDLINNPPISTADGKTLIVQRDFNSTTKGALEIINISDYSNPTLLGSYNTTEKIQEIRYLEDSQKAVIIYREEKMSLLDLSDFTKPTLIANFSTKEFSLVRTVLFSPDGSKAYMISSNNESTLSILDLSDFSNGKIISQTKVHPTYKSVLTKDNNFIILIGTRITVYNVSNPESPFEVSSIRGEFNTIPFAALSADEKFLYMNVYAGTAYTLRIYDITNLSAIKILGDLLLPEADPDQERALTFSADNQKAYIGTVEGYILGMNISNPTLPFIQETWKVATLREKGEIQSVKLSPDEKKMIYTSGYEVGTIDLTVGYSLYLHTEHIRLGQKYAESTPILKLNGKQEYELFNKNQRFLKASLFSVKVNPAKKVPETSFIPFPYWMSFDKENQIFMVEPKKTENLGTYTIYSAFSTKIPENAFDKLLESQGESPLKNDDLITMLMTLGYIDNQMYLTSRFDLFQDFRIPKDWNSLKKGIFSVLKQYYFETFTIFDIVPSLEIRDTEDKILINTLSLDSIRVDVVLADKQNGFVNKQYGSIKPAITEGKSRIILEGSQKEINSALELLVVNLENTNILSAGTIIISDRLNPVVTKPFTNISKFFNINQVPRMEVPIQNQIDSSHLSTGTYFTINFRNGTFIDAFHNDLSFELANGDSRKNLPAWISFSNMSLRGTPPEELFGREMEFILIVRNEFKETKLHFTLNIKISPIFALKLLIKNSPYILTIIGLIVYANKIYNIVAKKRYRHPKDYYINVGEEISGIPPINFIWQEKQEFEVILKHLKEDIARELGKSLITNSELAEYFTTQQENPRINRAKMEKRIQETLPASNKLRLYCRGSESSYKLINQILFNQLTSYLLDNNDNVKKAFDEIKDIWADLVDWDTNGECKINPNKLAGMNNKSEGLNDGEYKIMNEPLKNIDLLKDAIIAYAFTKQSIDYRAIQAHIVIREKIESNGLKKLLKLDLKNVNFSDKGKIGYGMYYKIENDVLNFYGVPEEKLIEKTVVVQITTLKHRILREIWIHGVSKNRWNRLSELSSDDVRKGKDYEVY